MRLLLLILFLVSSLHLQADVAIGSKVNNFELMGHDGKSYELDSLKGKIIVLEWYNEGCPFVRKFYDTQVMQKLQTQHKDKIIWFTVSSSNKGKQGFLASVDIAKALYEKEKMQSKVLLLDGENGKVGQYFGAVTTPHMFIINEEGVLVYNGAIDSIASASKEDIKKATPYFENALMAALKKEKIPNAKNKPYGCSVKY